MQLLLPTFILTQPSLTSKPVLSASRRDAVMQLPSCEPQYHVSLSDDSSAEQPASDSQPEASCSSDNEEQQSTDHKDNQDSVAPCADTKSSSSIGPKSSSDNPQRPIPRRAIRCGNQATESVPDSDTYSAPPKPISGNRCRKQATTSVPDSGIVSSAEQPAEFTDQASEKASCAAPKADSSSRAKSSSAIQQQYPQRQIHSTTIRCGNQATESVPDSDTYAARPAPSRATRCGKQATESVPDSGILSSAEQPAQFTDQASGKASCAATKVSSSSRVKSSKATESVPDSDTYTARAHELTCKTYTKLWNQLYIYLKQTVDATTLSDFMELLHKICSSRERHHKGTHRQQPEEQIEKLLHIARTRRQLTLETLRRNFGRKINENIHIISSKHMEQMLQSGATERNILSIGLEEKLHMHCTSREYIPLFTHAACLACRLSM